MELEGVAETSGLVLNDCTGDWDELSVALGDMDESIIEIDGESEGEVEGPGLLFNWFGDGVEEDKGVTEGVLDGVKEGLALGVEEAVEDVLGEIEGVTELDMLADGDGERNKYNAPVLDSGGTNWTPVCRLKSFNFSFAYSDNFCALGLSLIWSAPIPMSACSLPKKWNSVPSSPFTEQNIDCKTQKSQTR